MFEAQLFQALGLGAGLGYSSFQDPSTLAQINEMAKSIQAGAPTPNLQTGGAGMQLESVDGVIANATYKESHFALMQWLRNNGLVRDISSTVHQWVRRDDFGSLMMPIAYGETATAPNLDPTIVRLSTTLRTLQAQGSYTLVAQAMGQNIVQPLPGTGLTVKDEAYLSVARRFLGRLSLDCYFGDSAIDSNEFDGFFKQINTAGTADVQVVDLRGGALSPDTVKKYANSGYDRTYAEYDSLMLDFELGGAFDRLLAPTIRAQYGQQVQIGVHPKQILFNMGAINFYNDTFLSPQRYIMPDGAVGSSAPSTPTLTGGQGAQPTAAGTSGLFTVDEEGTYRYRIRAVGANGVSAHVTTNTVAVTATQTVSMTLEDSGVSDVRYYLVYRLDPGETVYKFLKRVVKASDTTITDDNAVMAGTHNALLTRADYDYCGFVQLAPMQNVVQPISGLTQPFLFFQVACPFMRVPTKSIWFKNCGVPAVDTVL